MGNRAAGLRLGVSLVTLGGIFGCASVSHHEIDLPPQTLTEAPTETSEQEAALATPQHPQATDPTRNAADPAAAPAKPASTGGVTIIPPSKNDPPASGRKQTVVIQSGSADSDVTPRTLQQASESERERRASAEAPVAVITNRNLSNQASGGQVTVVRGAADAPAPATTGSAGQSTTVAAAAPAATAPAASGPATAGATPGAATTAAAGTPANGAANPSAALAEEYWRGQALKIRLDWKAAIEAVDQLQTEVADLRRRFYQEDDPYYRDNEIKPAWDRALDQLQEAKASAEAQERKLTRFLEDGQRAGALPGWLREGTEFEPPPTPGRAPADRRRTDDPWEPKVLEEEPREP